MNHKQNLFRVTSSLHHPSWKMIWMRMNLKMLWTTSTTRQKLKCQHIAWMEKCHQKMKRKTLKKNHQKHPRKNWMEFRIHWMLTMRSKSQMELWHQLPGEKVKNTGRLINNSTSSRLLCLPFYISSFLRTSSIFSKNNNGSPVTIFASIFTAIMFSTWDSQHQLRKRTVAWIISKSLHFCEFALLKLEWSDCLNNHSHLKLFLLI